MTAALCLLGYSAALVWFAPAALRHVTRRGLSPRLAVTVWLATIAVAVGGWTVGFAGILRDVLSHHPVHPVLGLCTDAVLALHHLGWGGDVALAAIGLCCGAVSFIMVRRIVNALQRLWRRSVEHAHAAYILGSPTHRPDVVMVRTNHAAAYCVAGRPDAIVVTSGAVQALSEPELAAVLDHERAHLAGRHPQLMMLLRAFAASLPALPLFPAAVAAVGRLVEMSADDSAARRHGRGPLLGGLVALADPAHTGGPALAAADTAVVARAERLAAPPLRGPLVREQVLLSAILAALVLSPVGLALICHA